MKQYHELLQEVLDFGVKKEDRTGVGTLSLFGTQKKYDLQEGFPLMTTKKLHFKSIAYELLWFLKGDTNIKFLNENGVKIWDEWADQEGNLGNIYGKQWTAWNGIDGQVINQIENVVHSLKYNPHSRRHIVNAWNVGELDKMALPPCHLLFQFYVNDRNQLSCQLYQRSCDIFLGCPYNIASYALLTQMIAHVLGMDLGYFVHTLGDYHLYLNHVEQAKIQLSRTPKRLPTLNVNARNRNIKSVFDFEYEDFEVLNYDAYPHIKAEVAI